MQQPFTRYIVPALFLFAFCLRLFCIFTQPYYIGPDGHEYDLVSNGIIQLLRGMPLANPELFYETAEKRGWLYPLFLAFVNLIYGGKDPHLAVRIFQAFIDSVSCLFLYFIGKELFGKRAGFLALAVASVYPAFLFFCTFISQETTTIFLLSALMLFIMKAFSLRRKSIFLLSGFLLGIITIYRPTFQFLFIPFSLTLWFMMKKRSMVRPFFYVIQAGFLMLIISWVMFAKAINSPVMLYGSSTWAIYETMRYDGWPSDMYFPATNRELTGLLEEEGFDPRSFRDGRLLPSGIYLKAARNNLLERPFFYCSQYMKRFDRIWWNIDTYPGRWHSQTVLVQLLFHRALVLLAVFGIPLFIIVSPYGILIMVIIFYATLISIPVVGIPRYNLPLMPYVIVLATSTLMYFSGEIKRLFNTQFKTRRMLLILTVIIAGIAVISVDINTLLLLFQGVQPGVLHVVKVAMTVFFLIGICFFCTVVFRGDVRFKTSINCFILIALFLSALYGNEALSDKIWHEWKAPLTENLQKVRQVIQLERPLDISKFEKANLLIDMFNSSGRHKAYKLAVSVNEERVIKFGEGIWSTPEKFNKGVLGFLYKVFFFDTYRLTPDDFRQWYTVPIPLDLLKNRTGFQIEIAFENIGPGDKQQEVAIFGDYANAGSDTVFEGPCFPGSAYDTALYKIMPYSGDNRLLRRTPLGSKKTESMFYDGAAWHHHDLADIFGIQSGTYRIRIELIGKKGEQVIL